MSEHRPFYGAGPMPLRWNDPKGTACPPREGCSCTFGQVDPMCEVCHPPRKPPEETPARKAP